MPKNCCMQLMMIFDYGALNNPENNEPNPKSISLLLFQEAPAFMLEFGMEFLSNERRIFALVGFGESTVDKDMNFYEFDEPISIIL